MKKIKEICSKPSDALQAMVDGLQDYGNRPTFKINMLSWGSSNGILCFGCAASCTIQRVAQKDFIPDNSVMSEVVDRATFLDFDIDELDFFEAAINDARMGMLANLFRFYGYDVENIPSYYHNADYYLSTSDWRKQLPKVVGFIDALKLGGY